MGHPSDDGPGPAPTTITYPPVLSVLARDHEGEWTEKAGAQVSRAANLPADSSTFGPNPTARRFGAVYDAARAEYTAALRGIRADLETAARNLALAAEEMRSRDENAGAAFTTLLSRWTSPQGFESHQRQEQARTTDEVVAGAATMADLQEGGAHGTAPADSTGAAPAGTTGESPSPTMTTTTTTPTSTTTPGPGA